LFSDGIRVLLEWWNAGGTVLALESESPASLSVAKI
jgi:hypothetical protein